MNQATDFVYKITTDNFSNSNDSKASLKKIPKGMVIATFPLQRLTKPNLFGSRDGTHKDL